MRFGAGKNKTLFDSESVSLEDLFWALGLSDIHYPVALYARETKVLEERIPALEATLEKLPKDQVRAARKELARMRETREKLDLEGQTQVRNLERVFLRIQAVKPSLTVNADQLTTLVSKRVFQSAGDAIFCAKLVKLFTKQRMQGFDLISFFDIWTEKLVHAVGCCTEAEIKHFAEFVREMMAMAIELRKDEEIDPTNHASWETNIAKALIHALTGEEVAAKRNALLLISKTCDGIFPVIEANAVELKSAVESLAFESGMADVATLAMSLARRIGSFESQWLDKSTPVAPPTVATSPTPAVDETKSESNIRRTRPNLDRQLEESVPRSTRRIANAGESDAKRLKQVDERPSRTNSKNDIIARPNRTNASNRR